MNRKSKDKIKINMKSAKQSSARISGTTDK